MIVFICVMFVCCCVPRVVSVADMRFFDSNDSKRSNNKHRRQCRVTSPSLLKRTAKLHTLTLRFQSVRNDSMMP